MVAYAGSAAAELAGHTDTVACLGVDPTGEVVATGGMDGSTRLWSTSSCEQLVVLDGPGEAIEWLAWHPKGTVLAVGSQDMSAWMYNAQQGQCMQVFTGHSGPVMAGKAQMPRSVPAGHVRCKGRYVMRIISLLILTGNVTVGYQTVTQLSRS